MVLLVVSVCNVVPWIQESMRKPGKLSFIYESEVLSWSKTNLNFSYSVRLTFIDIGILEKNVQACDKLIHICSAFKSFASRPSCIL